MIVALPLPKRICIGKQSLERHNPLRGSKVLFTIVILAPLF